MDQNPNDGRWKAELTFVLIAFIIIGGLTLAYAQTLFFYLQENPLFLSITVAVTLVGPVLAATGGYLFGRHRKGKESDRDKERMHEHHLTTLDMMGDILSGKPRSQVVDGTATTRMPQRNSLVPYIDNGIRVNHAIDYQTMAREWLQMGYPSFTREYLGKRGSSIGDNKNYQILTAYMVDKNVIHQTTGKLPTDDPAMQDHLLYQWADSTGKAYSIRDVGNWINQNDWSDIA